ncbi:MAG: type IV pilus assembly protein PilM [Thermogutta sp.]|nr:type IV pilus assembly protein PilM [Thermogutta sp.]HPU06318.1 type IV pilus assembly protein PilM [Thermogutta sp.]
MPKSEACWGIDIGNASLKALRLRPGESPSFVVADAFDYIEYPMLLTQPAADPPSLIETALRQFLSRNEVRGHKVAISVSGATGLARFIKLPPVELSKLPDVVRYEAKQQIPYDLNSVVWRYQRLDAGGSESGFTLGSTVGIFALKRDQVEAAIQPFANVGIEVDVIQLSPLAIFNYARFDAMPDLPPPDEYDPDNPPPSIVVISMGTDSTDLVITNGYRVWQRNIPIGGSHFTKALSKELKLTFSKAEHIKKNPTTHSDPKAVFQAMRSVFTELLSEIQRSISYYNTIDRAVEISRGIALGNPMKLQGLRAFLEKGLGFPLEHVDQFERLQGPDVLQSPVFRENLSCFGVTYGLALQGIGRAYMEINMLPDEIVQERFIRAKKPWALAAATTLLIGCTVSFAAQSLALSRVSPERFAAAERTAEQVLKTVQQYQSELASVESEFNRIKSIGQNLTSSIEGRLLWLELLSAINQCLPQYRPQAGAPADVVDISAVTDTEKQQQILEQRDEIHITSLEAIRTEQLETWWQRMGGWYRKPGETDTEPAETAQATAATGTATPGSPGAMMGSMTSPYGMSGMYGPESETGGYGPTGGGLFASVPARTPPPSDVQGPSGSGYVIRLTGYHFHNSDVAGPNQGAQYVRNTLIRNLEEGKFWINGKWVTAKELGIGYPILVNPGRIEVIRVADPNYRPPAGTPGAPGTGLPTGVAPGLGTMPTGSQTYPGVTAPGVSETGTVGTAGGKIPGVLTLRRFNFVVEFVWQPKTESEREKERLEQAAAAAAAQEAEAAASGGTGPATQGGQPTTETAPSGGAPAPGQVVPPGVPAAVGPAAPGNGMPPQMQPGTVVPPAAGQSSVPPGVTMPGVGGAMPPGAAPPTSTPVNPAEIPDAPVLPDAPVEPGAPAPGTPMTEPGQMQPGETQPGQAPTGQMPNG